MSYRALITFVQGDQREDVFVPLSEDFSEAEELADRVFGLAKSFQEAGEFYQARTDCLKRTWMTEEKRLEWIKTWADQHWTLTWQVKERESFLEIECKAGLAGKETIFLRRRRFWLKD